MDEVHALDRGEEILSVCPLEGGPVEGDSLHREAGVRDDGKLDFRPYWNVLPLMGEGHFRMLAAGEADEPLPGAGDGKGAADIVLALDDLELVGACRGIEGDLLAVQGQGGKLIGLVDRGRDDLDLRPHRLPAIVPFDQGVPRIGGNRPVGVLGGHDDGAVLRDRVLRLEGRPGDVRPCLDEEGVGGKGLPVQGVALDLVAFVRLSENPHLRPHRERPGAGKVDLPVKNPLFDSRGIELFRLGRAGRRAALDGRALGDGCRAAIDRGGASGER